MMSADSQGDPLPDIAPSRRSTVHVRSDLADRHAAEACDILYVITDLEVGGVPLHLLRLAGAMRDAGRSVQAVSLAPPGPVARRLAGAGIPVHSCAASGGRDVRVFRRLARLIRDLRPRLVHSMLFHANLAARVAARLAGLPRERLICEIQTVEIERRWHLLVDRWTWRLCRFTVGNSPSVIEHLARAARIPADRLRLVRGGIDTAVVEAAPPADRAALGCGPEDRLILWAGRLDPIKGLDVLLRAFVRVHAEIPASLLLLAGDGALRGSLEAQARDLGLERVVRFLGTRGDVPSLMKTCDVFAFPSRTEGLPNVLLEAMACGCAIVTTNAPGCRDLVAPERTGLVVRRDDEGALAGAMLRLLGDKAMASRLGAAAREEVTRHWHLRDMLTAYGRLYDEVGAPPR